MEEKLQNYPCRRIYPPLNFDPDDKFDSVFRTAESTFLRMNRIGKTLKIPTGFLSKTLDDNLGIKRVDITENVQLADAFQRQKEEFRRNSICCKEILLFYGTKPKKGQAEVFDLNQAPNGNDKLFCFGQGNFHLWQLN
jgi:hypothetical protein